MPHLKRYSSEKLVLIGFGLTLAVFLLIGGLTINFAMPINRLQSVEHTREVMFALDHLRVQVDQAESRQWAYFVTRDQHLLGERVAALASVQPAIDHLLALTQDNRAQQDRIRALHSAIDQQITILETSLAAFDSRGLNATGPLFDATRQASQNVFSLMLEAKNQETASLEILQARRTFRLYAVVASLFMLLLVLGLLAMRMRRNARLRLAEERAREAVRRTVLKANALQQAIFNSANFSSIATDAQGVIQIFNVGAERMLGYAAADVMNKITPADISDPEEIVARATALSVALGEEINPGFEALVFKASRGIEDIYELTYIRKDGSRFPAVVSVTALRDAHNAIIGYLLIGTDNSERKLVANELEHYRNHLEQLVDSRTIELAQARDAAVLASQAKSNFLATMSHELRTPLNAVVGLTGLLADSPLGRRQRGYADKIQLSAQALRTVIDDILDFSKIEAGALKLEQAPFSLNAILHTTAAIMGVSLRDKPVEVLFDVAPNMPDALMGDALRLQQIMLNLTSNAVKFTNEGDIVVSVRCLAQDATQVTLQIAVRDTGIGMAHEQLGLIFDGFVQAETSTTRTHGGTGLGLTISANLARLMGGEIGVNSTLGAGSEFHFNVTLARSASEPTATSSDLPAALNILIIDDHPQARAILTQTCIGFGWQATALDSGAAGLAELRRCAAQGVDYDLLLLDWRMPEMDGIEMLRQAYATEGIGLPLVVLMAPLFELEQAVAVADNKDLYLDGVVAKPMTPAHLFDAVARAYAGEFSVTLPLVGHVDRRLFGMRLLVAEDNELNQEVIEQVLVSAGAEVVIVADGLAAVRAVRSPGARFDAVLMDIQMPVMDGYTATRIIREDLGLLELPIIAFTAFAQPEDREKSRRAGMVGHIAKPLDVEDLLDLLVKGRLGSAHLAAGKAGSAPSAGAPAISLAGVDVATALSMFGGDQKRYKEILHKFIERHGGEADEARRLLNAQDADGAIQLLHGLSGMASLLQATELARLAAAAEAALSEGNPQQLPLLLDELQAAMRILVGSVNQLEALWADV